MTTEITILLDGYRKAVANVAAGAGGDVLRSESLKLVEAAAREALENAIERSTDRQRGWFIFVGCVAIALALYGRFAYGAVTAHCIEGTTACGSFDPNVRP